MIKKPIIGITLDAEPAGGYSKFPWYALRENYASSIVAHGGIPVPLPHEPELVPQFLTFLDGLVVTGGAFDVDPKLFGADQVHDTVVTKDRRTEFELAITKGMLALDRPVLGICGGEQLLNVILGGTLIQHIPDEVSDCLAHEQPNPRDQAGHEVTVFEGTLLHRIVCKETLNVNSAHHQAVKSVGPSVRINSKTSDGVVEGIESAEYRFCLGVQWHPEFLIDEGDGRILRAFVEAARGS